MADRPGFDWATALLLAGGAWVLWSIWRESADYQGYEPAPSQPSPGGANAAPDLPGGLEFSPDAPDTGLAGDILNAIIPQNLSPQGAAILKNREGWTPVPVPDAGGFEIGWGHWFPAGTQFKAGAAITQADGQALFNGDTAAAIDLIRRNVHAPLSQAQFDALVSLAYDAPAALGPNSSVTRNLNVQNYAGAAGAILLYKKSQGQTNPALVKRRKAEQQQFTG